MDPRLGQHRHAVYGCLQDRLKVIKVFGKLIKFEIGRNPVHPPGLGVGFKGAEQHFTGVFFVIGTLIGHAQHR